MNQQAAEQHENSVTKLRSYLDLTDNRLAGMLPTELVPVDRFKACILSLYRDPDMAGVSFREFGLAAMRIAAIGLDPSPDQNLVYLVPFYNKKKEEMQLQLIIGYQGYKELAYRTQTYAQIYSDVVYVPELTMDEKTGYGFEWIEGPRRHFYHKRDPMRDFTDERIAGSYSIATDKQHPDMALAWKFVPTWKILRHHKAKSNSAGNPKSPWNTCPAEMYMKTSSRVLAKDLQKSVQLARALAIDDVPPDEIHDEFAGAIDIKPQNGNGNGNSETPAKADDFNDSEMMELGPYMKEVHDIHNKRQIAQWLKQHPITKEKLLADAQAHLGGPKLVEGGVK